MCSVMLWRKTLRRTIIDNFDLDLGLMTVYLRTKRDNDRYTGSHELKRQGVKGVDVLVINV